MSFSQPQFLYGLTAISLPILIHILNFRRYKKMYFSNVEGLIKVQSQKKSIKTLKNWLLLLIRVLIIITLVLAFAQPNFSTNAVTLHSDNLSSFFVDNSYSMQAQGDENKSLLDESIKKTKEILYQFSPNAKAQIHTHDFSEKSQYSQVQQARDFLSELKYSPIARTAIQIFERQKQLADKQGFKENRQLYWLSDFQKSTFSDIQKLKSDTITPLILVPFQSPALQNVFVDSVYLQNPFIRQLQKNQLWVRFRHSGKKETENLVVKLVIDSVQVASQIISIKPESQSLIKFDFSISTKGKKKCWIAFEDNPIYFDNDYFFVLEAMPKITIGHIFTTSDPYIKQVFSNDSLFDFRSFSIQNVDLGKLKTNDLVILENGDKLSGSLEKELKDFILEGGTALITPATQESSSLLVFLGQLGFSAQYKNTTSNLEPLAQMDKNNPFYADIFENYTSERLQMPSATQFLNINTPVSKILQFRNGQGFLVEKKVGKGKVYLFTSPLGAKYSTFGQNAFFLPVLYKIASSSIGKKTLSYTFSQKSILVPRVPTTKNSIYKLRHKSLEIIPLQSKENDNLRIEIPTSTEFPKGAETGFYDLILEGKIIKTFAINADTKESILNFYTEEDLKNIFSSQKNIQVKSYQDFMKNFHTFAHHWELWKYLIFTTLIFVALEIFIIRSLR